MTDHPGCTVDGCTHAAAYKILYDDRLMDQYRCVTHAIDDLSRLTDDTTP